ncbi:oxidoreductase-like domain-containing protein [Eleftheria terrae]|uniref:oxidoreductase-like domain-containing protein n=1 Tax=Eleftheria terrae TaxID=1597781 RepID=UPI003F4D9A3E
MKPARQDLLPCDAVVMKPADLPDDPQPVPPREPALDECCGQGCEPCIFDLYEAARQRYLAELQAWQARHASRLTPDGSS